MSGMVVFGLLMVIKLNQFFKMGGTTRRVKPEVSKNRQVPGGALALCQLVAGDWVSLYWLGLVF